jgi:hypothetical protein
MKGLKRGNTYPFESYMVKICGFALSETAISKKFADLGFAE